MQRREFIKSTAAVAVAAELEWVKCRRRFPPTTGETTTSAPSPRDRSPQSGSVPSIPTDAVIPTDDVVMTTTSSEDVGRTMAWDWSPISRQTVARRKSSQTIFLRRSKTWFDFLWASSFMSVRLEGSTAAAWTPGDARLSEARL